MKLFKYSVGTNVYEEGVTAFPVVGEAVMVDGISMVRLHAGYINTADGWHTTQEAALMDAAEQIGRMGLRLLDQAATLRAKSLSGEGL